jgi:hypothetical protein
MCRWTAGVAAFLFGLGLAWAQEDPKDDDKYKPDSGKEDDELTPEEAMRLLKEAHGLMLKSAELLNDSSRGKALETDAEIMKRLEELLKEEEKKDPSILQKKILEKIQKMLGKTEKKQTETIEKLNEIIKRAKS